MGEAKLKEDRRRQQATKIVEAFERFIDANITVAYSDEITHSMRTELDASRKGLIDILVAPPPR